MSRRDLIDPESLAETDVPRAEADPKKRILLARSHHETNAFMQGRTMLEDFDIGRGAEILQAEEGRSSLSEKRSSLPR